VSQFLDGKVTLYAGDCLDVLATLPENSVDSVVCDPPYHLTSIVKRFGNSDPEDVEKNATARKIAGQGTSPHGRAAAGFMGKQWDGGDIAFQPSTWAAVLRVLKPGGYILAFASTRGFGRMSVALEDAGFITHPFVAWIFGSGFPKATRIKADGYDGWRYGGQALKPAIEPIYMGQKPFSEINGTANILRWGTGALNIDGCRVETSQADQEYISERISGFNATKSIGGVGSGILGGGKVMDRGASYDASKGRWPANIIHDGSDEVRAAFPSAPGQQQDIDPQAPSPKTGHIYGAMKREGEYSADRRYTREGATNFAALPGARRNDAGSAARFFYAVEKETRCDLCSVLLSDRNDRLDACDASTAIPSSATPGTLTGSTAHCDAAGLPPPDSEGRKQPSNGHAHVAGNRSDQCRPQSGNIAQGDALTQETSRIAPSVRSAANLCASCETDIAQSLAATRLGLDPASRPCLESMPARRRQILRQHLALYVEGRESTDTITTTASLKTLFGSVLHAIADTTSLEKVEGPESTEPARRLFYSSKADAEDRLGSKHPTVKPLDLMQYLVRLVTPPGGLVLDPFAGTGTTGEAAWREGMRAVLIEREPEYQADIARRMDLAENPTKRAAVAKSKNNLQGAEGTPLFGGEAAKQRGARMQGRVG